MANPAQQAARSNPKAWRDDQPENAAPDRAVVNLAHTWNEETQDCCRSRIFHNDAYLHASLIRRWCCQKFAEMFAPLRRA